MNTQDCSSSKGGIKAKNLRKIIVQAGLNNISRIYVIPIGDCITDIESRVIHEYQDKLYSILRIQDTGDHLTIHSKNEFTNDLAEKMVFE